MEQNVNCDTSATIVKTISSRIVVGNKHEMNSMTTVTSNTTTTAVLHAECTSNDAGNAAAMRPECDQIFKPQLKPDTYLTDLESKIPVEIRFEGITYRVRDGCRGFKKTVLHQINGKFSPNKLIAIMGPSGAGKSTLLDLISGYRIGGLEGKVIVNGRFRVLEEFRRISCYIQQDDRIQPLLTVQENMILAADLKLGPNVSPKRKSDMVDEILSVLGLRETVNTRGSRLSGGQQKRLSIALELISNPLVMFLDEPTTGLDSSSCSQCISLLRKLAHQGRTIICTIHQPSASLFQMFDQVYILTQGKCLYQGTTDNMLSYLSSLQLSCPVYHNPADFIIEIASGEYGEDKIKALCAAISNGSSLEWFKSSKSINDVGFTPTIDEKPPKDCLKFSKQMTPPSYQLNTLLRRGFIKLKRDQTLTYMRIIVNFLVSIMLGLLYVNSGEDASKVFDNYNLLFSVIMHHVMSSMMLNIISFPMEMNILLKEHFNRWYSLKMYYFANILLDIPAAAFSCVVFSSIVYIVSGQLFTWYRYGLYMVTSILIVFIAQSLGYVFGTFFDVVNGTFAGPIFMIPMMMFSGFGVNLRDIPSYLKWGTHVSFFRYALENYVAAVYGTDRREFTCFTVYCHYKDPKLFLEEIAMSEIDVTFALQMLVLTLVTVRVLGYFVLSWKVRLGR